MSEPSGYLAECFISHQGEGSWLGFRQLFLRLAGCQLGCDYCDTRWAQTQKPRTWRLHFPGDRSKAVQRHPNPVTPKDLGARLDGWLRAHGPCHSLAVTGGEPLEQADFLEPFLVVAQRLKPRMKVLLETNGAHAGLGRFKGLVDFIAMDIKLKSGGGFLLPVRHVQQALASAVWCSGCAKLVIKPGTPEGDVAEAARLVRHRAPEWEVVLQPVAGTTWQTPANQRHLDNLSRAALEHNPRSRLIPQMHRLLGFA